MPSRSHLRPAIRALKAAGLGIAAALAACSMASDGKASGPDGLMAWPDLLERPKPAADRTVSYGTDPLQVADLWLPKSRGPHPVVLMVHGGCWTTEIAERDIMNWIADDLRKLGIAVWNIEYRGVDRPGGGYPGTFLDAGAAADALRAQAAAANLDLSRLVAVGHSAGGHLALWLAARPRLPKDSPLRTADPLRIPTVISLGGLPDLEQAARPPGSGCGTEVIGQLTGGRFADTSVPRLAPLGVTQVLVNGENDRIIPTAFAPNYAAKMNESGDRATVHMIPRTGHVELIAPETPAWKATIEAIETALGR